MPSLPILVGFYGKNASLGRNESWSGIAGMGKNGVEKSGLRSGAKRRVQAVTPEGIFWRIGSDWDPSRKLRLFGGRKNSLFGEKMLQNEPSGMKKAEVREKKQQRPKVAP